MTNSRTVVGFTGTQAGMTDHQKEAVTSLLKHLDPIEAHHGDCIGADTGFHKIARGMGITMVGHPASGVEEKRAYNSGFYFLHDPRHPLERNKDIVDASTVIVAVPRGYEEVLRSGTWATVRYARKAGKDLNIVYPDGYTQYSEGVSR